MTRLRNKKYRRRRATSSVVPLRPYAKPVMHAIVSPCTVCTNYVYRRRVTDSKQRVGIVMRVSIAVQVPWGDTLRFTFDKLLRLSRRSVYTMYRVFWYSSTNAFSPIQQWFYLILIFLFYFARNWKNYILFYCFKMNPTYWMQMCVAYYRLNRI